MTTAITPIPAGYATVGIEDLDSILADEIASKTYVGVRDENGTAQVYIEEQGERRLLHHPVRHSPTGFEWGYGGSGPADLARALLLDATGSTEAYMDFKWSVIANLPTGLPTTGLTLPKDCWRMTEGSVQSIAHALRMRKADSKRATA
jgi:hypothetical protein